MSVLLKKILWYKVKDGANDTSSGLFTYTDPVTLQAGTSSSIVKGLDIKNNILTLTLNNNITGIDSDGNLIYQFTNSEGNLIFSEQDKIKIWQHYTDDASDIESATWGNNTTSTPTDSTYLLGDFYVIEFQVRHTENGREIVLKCADKTYVVFNRVFANSYKSADDWTSPKIIQDVIRNTCQSTLGEYGGTGSNPNVTYTIKADLVSESGNITNTRRDVREDGTVNADTDFPSIDIANQWKPVYEWIQELSQVENLNTATELDGTTELVYGKPFIFWVDEDNEFHWIYPDDSSPTSINIGTTEGVISVNLNKKVFDVVNMVIFNAGNDMYETGIWDFFYDSSTDSRALKITYKPMTDIANNLIERDYTINSTREGTPAGKPFPQFVTDVSYPLATTFWGDTSGIANDGDYNDSLRAESKNRGKRQAQRITSKLSKARWAGSINFKGSKFTAGTLLKITDPGIGLVNTNIRINNVRHSTNKNVWVTSLECEEDPNIQLTKI